MELPTQVTLKLENANDGGLSSQSLENRESTWNDCDFIVKDKPVMSSAIDVISILGKKNKIILRAKGDHIPNAVAIANVVTTKLLKGNSKVFKILVDSEDVKNLGKTLSIIEIFLIKTS